MHLRPFGSVPLLIPLFFLSYSLLLLHAYPDPADNQPSISTTDHHNESAAPSENRSKRFGGWGGGTYRYGPCGYGGCGGGGGYGYGGGGWVNMGYGYGVRPYGWTPWRTGGGGYGY